jgi:hypothetical protein
MDFAAAADCLAAAQSMQRRLLASVWRIASLSAIHFDEPENLSSIRRLRR